MIGLLNLHQDIQVLIEHRQLSMGHARALSKLDEKIALKLVQKVIHEHLSVRKLETIIQELKVKPKEVHIQTSTHIMTIENRYKIQAVHKEGKLTLQGDENTIQKLISVLVDYQD